SELVIRAKSPPGKTAVPDQGAAEPSGASGAQPTQVIVEIAPPGGRLAGLERWGKALGWVCQLVIAVAAVVLTIFTLNLNRQNYIFQKRSIAINATLRLAEDFTKPDQRQGNYCIGVALRLKDLDRPGGDFAKWFATPGVGFPAYIFDP